MRQRPILQIHTVTFLMSQCVNNFTIKKILTLYIILVILSVHPNNAYLLRFILDEDKQDEPRWILNKYSPSE